MEIIYELSRNTKGIKKVGFSKSAYKVGQFIIVVNQYSGLTMNVKRRLFLACLFSSFFANGQEPLYDYVFFANSRMQGNYFFSSTKAIAPSYVKNENQKLPVNEAIFHTPGNALQFEYRNHEDGLWRATIYRQQFRGQDHFKKANYLSFWIYNPSASTKSDDLPALQLMMKD